MRKEEQARNIIRSKRSSFTFFLSGFSPEVEDLLLVAHSLAPFFTISGRVTSDHFLLYKIGTFCGEFGANLVALNYLAGAVYGDWNEGSKRRNQKWMDGWMDALSPGEEKRTT